MGTEVVVFLKVFFQDYCRLLRTAIGGGDVGGGDVGGSKGGVDETCGRARGSQMTVCIAMRCRREEVGEGAIPGMRVEIARAEVIRLR